MGGGEVRPARAPYTATHGLTPVPWRSIANEGRTPTCASNKDISAFGWRKNDVCPISCNTADPRLSSRVEFIDPTFLHAKNVDAGPRLLGERTRTRLTGRGG